LANDDNNYNIDLILDNNVQNYCSYTYNTIIIPRKPREMCHRNTLFVYISRFLDGTHSYYLFFFFSLGQNRSDHITYNIVVRRSKQLSVLAHAFVSPCVCLILLYTYY